MDSFQANQVSPRSSKNTFRIAGEHSGDCPVEPQRAQFLRPRSPLGLFMPSVSKGEPLDVGPSHSSVRSDRQAC